MLHFIPFAVYFFGAGFIPYQPGTQWMILFRFGILIQLLFYLMFSFGILKKVYLKVKHNAGSSIKHDFRWMAGIFVGITLVWSGYFLSPVIHVPDYILGAILYSFGIYLVTYVLLKNNRIIRQEDAKERYQSSTLTPEETQKHLQTLSEAIEVDKVYRIPDITLRKLARRLTVNPNDLSRIINENFGRNFPDFINAQRIKEAQELLKRNHNSIKIATVAYDTGFNSLSAFNKAFKKNTGLTPSEFRDRQSVAQRN